MANGQKPSLGGSAIGCAFAQPAFASDGWYNKADPPKAHPDKPKNASRGVPCGIDTQYQTTAMLHGTPHFLLFTWNGSLCLALFVLRVSNLEKPLQHAQVNGGECGQVGDFNMLIHLMHGLANQAKLHHRTIVFDKACI